MYFLSLSLLSPSVSIETCSEWAWRSLATKRKSSPPSRRSGYTKPRPPFSTDQWQPCPAALSKPTTLRMTLSRAHSLYLTTEPFDQSETWEAVRLLMVRPMRGWNSTKNSDYERSVAAERPLCSLCFIMFDSGATRLRLPCWSDQSEPRTELTTASHPLLRKTKAPYNPGLTGQSASSTART